MENASKALLIAAAVLIAILIASLAVYLFTSMSESTANMYKRLEASEIAEFNQQFLNYNDRGLTPTGYKDTNGNGKKDVGEEETYNPLTIQDVATIVNLAVDYNKTQKFNTKITVEIKSGCICGGISDWTERYKNAVVDTILKEHMSDLQNNRRFTCKVSIDSQTTVVNNVEIKAYTGP